MAETKAKIEVELDTAKAEAQLARLYGGGAGGGGSARPGSGGGGGGAASGGGGHASPGGGGGAGSFAQGALAARGLGGRAMGFLRAAAPAAAAAGLANEVFPILGNSVGNAFEAFKNERRLHRDSTLDQAGFSDARIGSEAGRLAIERTVDVFSAAGPNVPTEQIVAFKDQVARLERLRLEGETSIRARLSRDELGSLGGATAGAQANAAKALRDAMGSSNIFPHR